MKTLIGFALSILLAAGADPAPQPKTFLGIKFPTLPSSPDRKDVKPLDPSAPAVLTADVFYVVEDETPFLLYASPSNLVTVTKESGPIRLRGKFVDGNGKVETREYKSKHVAIVEAAPDAMGTVELIASSVGATDEKAATRRTVLVKTGTGPQPPPVDPVEPKPPVTVKTFRVLLVYESGDTLPASVTSVLYGKVVEEFLTANCTGGAKGWARLDKDAPGDYDDERKGVWNAVKGEFPKTKVPALVIQVNDKVTIEPFGATPAATVAILRKYLEGK